VIAPFVVILDSMPSSDNKSKIIVDGTQRIMKASGEVKGARKGKVGRDGT
jgi:hypothetical protein